VNYLVKVKHKDDNSWHYYTGYYHAAIISTNKDIKYKSRFLLDKVSAEKLAFEVILDKKVQGYELGAVAVVKTLTTPPYSEVEVTIFKELK
jgi:hypothetical protein